MFLNGNLHRLEYLDSIPCLEVEMHGNHTFYPNQKLSLGRGLAKMGVRKVTIVLLWSYANLRDELECDVSGVTLKVDTELAVREIFLQQVAEWALWTLRLLSSGELVLILDLILDLILELTLREPEP